VQDRSKCIEKIQRFNFFPLRTHEAHTIITRENIIRLTGLTIVFAGLLIVLYYLMVALLGMMF